MRRDKIEVMAAKKRKGTCFLFPSCSGSSLSLSLTVAVTGAFSSFDDELSVTTGAGFSAPLLGNILEGSQLVALLFQLSFVCYLPQSLDLELVSCFWVGEPWVIVTVHFNT